MAKKFKKLLKNIKNWYKNVDKKKFWGIVIGIVGIILIIIIGISVTKMVEDKKEEPQEIKEEVKEEPKITIVDPTSNTRCYAVMINNHPQARAHHAGLQDAYIVYEIIVEGGMTRYMALFKDQTTEKIGSVRSARHYYLDYAMENDCMYVHWGWSPQAQDNISSYKINNINGLTWEGRFFYRDTTLGISREHTGFTTMQMLNDAADKMKYNKTSDSKLLLNYTVNKVDLSGMEDATKADKVTIKYSNSVTDTYTYDSDNGYYLRSVNGKEHVDDVTKNQYHFKNIITYQVENHTIGGDNKGRQDIDNVGTGEGYYITNGYAVKIKWSKESRSDKTKYTYLDGKEIDVSDGNTFIQIQPKGQTIKFESNNQE